MTFSELKEKMEAAGSTGGSSLHLRNEDLQQKKRVKRIPMLKNALKKCSKLLLEMELAFPFNPETGEADDVFNASNKYRPPFSATATALAIKNEANTNEALKAVLMRRSGVSAWDTSDSTVLTAEDKNVFKPFRVPRIFSLSVVHVNIPAMNTGQFGRDYAVSVKRDEQGNIIGDFPSFLAANKFFNDRAYEEVQAYRDLCAAQPATAGTEQEQKNHISEIYNRNPVSDDKPANFVRLFELPLASNLTLSNEIDLEGITSEKLRDFEVISRYKKGIRSCVEDYMNGKYSMFDKHFDFLEIELNCPSEGDDTTIKGKADIGKDTKYEKPTFTLDNPDCANGRSTDTLIAAFRKYVDSDADLEKKIRNSMRVPVYNDTVEAQLFESLPSVLNIRSDKFVTEKVICNNADFIRNVLGDEGDEIVEEASANVSGKAEGSLDSGSAATEAKEYSIDDIMSSDESPDLQELDLEMEDAVPVS